MASVVRGFVEGIGIADSLPEDPKWFTQVTVPETIVIPEQKPDMEQLLSVMVDAKVISVRLVDTPNATSYEGQALSGCKLLIDLKLREKVKYVADEPTQSVHAAHFENVLKSVYVVVPCEIEIDDDKYVSIKELLKKNKIVVTPYIEDIYAVMRDKRTIFKNIAMLIDVKVLK